VRHEDARDPGSEQKHYPPVPTLIMRRTLRPDGVPLSCAWYGAASNDGHPQSGRTT
jgi:hypothetical protein